MSNDDAPGWLRIPYLSAGLVFGVTIGLLVEADDYKNGQIDALNGVWRYQKVTTVDGAVHYLAVTTQPGK